MADTIASRIDQLCGVPMFEGLTKKALTEVARALKPFETEAGHVLIRPKTPGAGLFIITTGTCVADLGSRTEEIGAGEFLGELALLDDRALRTVGVRAKTDVTGFVLGRDDFERILAKEPKIAVGMLRSLARRFVDRLQ